MVNSKSVTILRDDDLKLIDGLVCKVINFTPWSVIENGKVKSLNKSFDPYAALTVQCSKYEEELNWFITHKKDFIHLWEAFKIRGIKKNEEVLIAYSSSEWSGLQKLFAFILPKLHILICHVGAYELISNKNYRPELTGEARFLAERPIIEWNPL